MYANPLPADGTDPILFLRRFQRQSAIENQPILRRSTSQVEADQATCFVRISKQASERQETGLLITPRSFPVSTNYPLQYSATGFYFARPLGYNAPLGFTGLGETLEQQRARAGTNLGSAGSGLAYPALIRSVIASGDIFAACILMAALSEEQEHS